MMLEDFGRTRMDELIHEWIIGKNAERNRAIYARRVFDGITFERLAEEFDMSPRQTREIVHQCEKKIFKHFPG